MLSSSLDFPSHTHHHHPPPRPVADGTHSPAPQLRPGLLPSVPPELSGLVLASRPWRVTVETLRPLGLCPRPLHVPTALTHSPPGLHVSVWGQVWPRRSERGQEFQ